MQTNKTNSDNAISQVSQKADNVKVTIENNLNNTDPSKSAYKSISQLQVNINGLTSTVQSNKSATDTQISQIKQNANSLSSTVQTYHTDANNKISGLSSKVNQNADSITSVVTNLSDSDKAKNNYSAIAQMQDDIALRVSKDDVVNQINISKESILIDGNKVHITGDTKIDKNVVVGGMIAANSITADKLSSETIALSNNQGIQGGNVTLDANGMACTDSNGMTIQFGQDGMTSKDKNGNKFSILAQCMIGVAKNGQYVKFANPWTESPTVIVTPQNIQTNNPAYSTSKVRLHCYADEVTVNGFRMRAYSGIADGAGSLAKNQRCGTMTWTIWRSSSYRNLSTDFGSRSISFDVSMPSNASSVVLHGRLRTNAHFKWPEMKIPNSTKYQKLEVKCNGTTTYSGVLWNSGDGEVGVDKNIDTYTAVTSNSISVTQGATLNCTLTIAPCVDHPGDDSDPLDIEFILDSIDCKVEGEQVLDADGTGAFFVVNRSNGLYTLQE